MSFTNNSPVFSNVIDLEFYRRFRVIFFLEEDELYFLAHHKE